jgi:hypothetical protein
MLPKILIEILGSLDEQRAEYVELGKREDHHYKKVSIIGISVVGKMKRKIVKIIKKHYDRSKPKRRNLSRIRSKNPTKKNSKSSRTGKRSQVL